MKNVTEFPVSNDMTVQQALESAMIHSDDLEQVFIVGFYPDGDMFSRSSKATRENAVWAAEKLKQHALSG